MKKLVRYYSLGLLTSAGVLLAVYMLTSPSEASLAESDPEEMIALLEDKGYAVLTQEQYIKLSVKPEETEEAAEEETAAVAEEQEQIEEDKDANDQEENTSEEDEEVEAEKEKEEQKEKEEKSSEKTEEDSVVKYKLSITPGMASSDVSSLLANENIIENASEFNSYLDEHDYSQYVQQGTFELSSDMSFYEIAERIAR